MDKPAATSCDDVECKSPATCDVKDGKARCSCPSGYDDPKGDGSDCQDKDECKNSDDNDCANNAKCENEPGGYKCTCIGPAYKGDGKSCSCADGYQEKDGACLAPDSKQCEDNLDCQNAHCVSGVCCATDCGAPDAECRTSEGATCEDGHTCKYPVAKDGAGCEDGDFCTKGSTCKGGKCQMGTQPTNCDDGNPCTDDSCDSTIGCKNANNMSACDDKNPCTENDHCANGTCSMLTLKNCSGQSDACNAGVCDPTSGECKQQPMSDGMSCDDMTSCTTGDRCQAGKCTGPSACGPNATGCTAGAPNTCVCADGYQASSGKCVPNNNECATNNGGCDANADCFDTSNDPNTVTCSCKPDYTGDGKTCVLTNPCMNNPCGEGRGTCTNQPGGKHTCACNAGLTEVAGQCVCNMGGTWAMRNELSLKWATQTGIAAGQGSTYAWTIQRHNYDVNGHMEMEIISCGETNLDLCGTGVGIINIPVEAYAQYIPIAVYDKPTSNATPVSFDLLAPLPTTAFKTPQYAALQGIELTDRLGTWPPSRKDVQGFTGFDGSAVNGARWLDTDNDTFFGLTTYAVGPSGAAADGSALAPIEGYGTRSVVCPRDNANAERSPYNYPPAIEGLTPRRVKRFSSANRVISALEGTIDSCDQVSGKVTGPDNGQVHFDIRIGSCVRVDTTRDNGEVSCSDGVLDFLDGTSTPNEVLANPFIMKRVKDDITCAEVRKLAF